MEHIKEFNIDNHCREVDSFFYKKIFSKNQYAFSEFVYIRTIVCYAIGKTPAPKINNKLIAELNRLYIEQLSYVDYSNCYICSFRKTESYETNYDVMLVIEKPKHVKLEKLTKWIMSNLMSNEYSEFLQHDLEVNYGILNYEKTDALFYSVTHDEQMNYFISLKRFIIKH